MDKLELLDLFKQKIQKEYENFYNSLFFKDKSEIFNEDNIEEIYYTQKFKNIAEKLDTDIEIEYIFNIDDILRKVYIIYHFDSFADDRTDYNYVFHDMVDYEKFQVRAKMEKNDLSLAERLDSFYAETNPYDRYDSVGSFSPEFDSDEEGLSQIKECLTSAKGKEHIKEYLYDVIASEYDEEIKEKAKQFFIELNDLKIQKEKDESEM